MASAISALSSTPAATASSPLSGTSAPPSKEVFLQLLVAQIKAQDPLNPSDGAQFVAQLAQFSQLEQVIAIRTAIESQNKTPDPAAGTTPAAAQ